MIQRSIFFILVQALLVWAAEVELDRWKKGESFLGFLQREGLPKELYYSLDPEEKELVSELYAGVPYYRLVERGELRQALIPINEELQIHIYKKEKGYAIELIPIDYVKKSEKILLTLSGAPYNQLIDATHNPRLAHEFVRAFKHDLSLFRHLRKGDKLALLYDQKYRLGRLFGMPDLKAAMVQAGSKRYYVFGYKGRFYDEDGRELERFYLVRPIRSARITSRFSPRRYHPILKRYRAHLGVDFGARKGTPIYAAGDGRVVYAGRKGGYGKVVEIAHGDGYKTLYAHMSRIRKGIRRGKWVRQGQVIGYVGNTGLSTGSHLHFGLYRNNRPINPLRVVRITKSRLSGKELRQFKKEVSSYKKQIARMLQSSKDIVPGAPQDSIVSHIGGEDGKRATVEGG
jgi:murein DD-endopeptidase MepM/ murein hydrolase activator NlpD